MLSSPSNESLASTDVVALERASTRLLTVAALSCVRAGAREATALPLDAWRLARRCARHCGARRRAAARAALRESKAVPLALPCRAATMPAAALRCTPPAPHCGSGSATRKSTFSGKLL